MSKVGSNYVHYQPQVRMHPEFPNCLGMHLIKSLDELKSVLATRGDYLAWDTETSDLSPEVGEIVGFSFCFSAKEGWYVPVNHIGCHYNLGHESLELFYNRLCQCKKTFVYNMRFDFRFMEWAGFDMSKVQWFDVSIPVFMSDTNVPMMSLKRSERLFLGWDPSTFEETLGEATSFQYLDPEEGYRYAVADCLGTFALAGATANYYKEAKFCCDLDNAVLYPLMKFEDNPLKIDVKLLRTMADEELQDIDRLSREIYDLVGYEFEIGSNKQLGEALASVGINTGHFTAKGQMKVDIKTLALMAKDHPVLPKIIERSKKFKAVNSYMKSLADQAEKRDGTGRFAYLTTRVPTGRLASGGDKKNSYFLGLNIQSVPKPTQCMWYVHDYVEGQTVLEPGEIRVDKWFFSLKRKSGYQIEGFSPKSNIRSAFTVDEGCYWVSCDYSSQELCIVANLSNEPLWLNTLLSGGDLHKCYSDDTEFLTESGWRKYDEISPGEKIAQVKDGKVEFVVPTDRYSGISKEMVSLKNKEGLVDLLVTPNHRVLFRTSSKNKWKVWNAERLVGRPCVHLPVSVTYDGVERTEPFRFSEVKENGRLYTPALEFDADTFIEYLGFYVGDGHAGTHEIKGGHSYRLNIAQSLKESKASAWLRDLNRRMGGFFRENLSNPGVLILEASNREVVKFIEREFLSTGHKRIPRWIFGLSLRQRELFLQAFIKADGHTPKSKEYRMLYSKYQDLLNDLMELATLNGYRVHQYPEHDKTHICLLKGRRIESGYIPYCGIVKRESAPVKAERVKESQRVVCFTVPSGMLLVKRNGQPVVCGNSMAIAMWGEANYSKAARRRAKAANFGLIYLMKPFSMPDKFNEPLEVCQDIYDKFWKAIPNVKAFQDKLIRRSRRIGTVYNYLGRPRRVKFWFNSPEGRDHAFACRTVVNTVVQSMGGEILKISMLKLWKALFNNPVYRDRGVRFMNTIHDEINTQCPADLLHEVVALKKKCMTRKFPNWKLPINIGLEIGPNWGLTFPFKFKNEEGTEFVPKMEPVKE